MIRFDWPKLLTLAEFGFGISMSIQEMGFRNFASSLKTPQGALQLVYDLLTLKASGVGSSRRGAAGRSAPLPDPAGEQPPPPRLKITPSQKPSTAAPAPPDEPPLPFPRLARELPFLLVLAPAKTIRRNPGRKPAGLP